MTTSIIPCVPFTVRVHVIDGKGVLFISKLLDKNRRYYLLTSATLR
jgi:hypothetical protein